MSVYLSTLPSPSHGMCQVRDLVCTKPIVYIRAYYVCDDPPMQVGFTAIMHLE